MYSHIAIVMWLIFMVMQLSGSLGTTFINTTTITSTSPPSRPSDEQHTTAYMDKNIFPKGDPVTIWPLEVTHIQLCLQYGEDDLHIAPPGNNSHRISPQEKKYWVPDTPHIHLAGQITPGCKTEVLYGSFATGHIFHVITK